jgi:histidinol phosphatase-like PHP family hydrolase
MHDEFAAAAREYDTVVEVNLAGMLLNPQYPERFRRQYLDYLAGLKAAGVRLSIGSDCHSSHYDADFQGASALLATAGFTARDFWRLPPGPP